MYNPIRLFTLALVLVFSAAACNDTVNVETSGGAETLLFPDGFLLGTAVAAHQVEGNLGNDMSMWEDVSPDADGECKIRNCDKTRDPTPASGWGQGLYKEDFARAKALGNNTIRVGFEWGRIEPYPGEISAEAIQYYHDMLAEMKANGLTPMVTVNHFTLPPWVQTIIDEGNGEYSVPVTAQGWLDASIAEKMGDFAARLATEYGAEVDYWCTINEPWSVLLGGFLAGVLPPGKTLDVDGMFDAAENMLRAHAAIYHAIKANDKIDADGDGVATYVGMVRHDRKPLPLDEKKESDWEAAKKADYIMTNLLNDAIVTGKFDKDADGEADIDIPGLKGTTDYWGVNYYGVLHMDSTFNLPYVGGIPELDASKAGFPVNDLGWGIYPDGFRERLKLYWDKWGTINGKQVFLIVTENGVADSQDTIRPKFLVDHLDQLLLSIHKDGVDVRGYYHWTLIDNFEWAEGYEALFGLYLVDQETQVRTETKGAQAYREIAAAGGITPALREKYAKGEYAAPNRLQVEYFAPPYSRR